MKKLESSLLNMVLVLTGVAVIVGCILAWINNITTDPITLQEKKALTNGIRKVMQADSLNISAPEKPDTIVMADSKGKEHCYLIYHVKDEAGHDMGAAVQDTVKGFGGPLVVLVGFDTTGTIKGYTLLKQAETPGLGAKAEQWFQKGQKGDIIDKRPTADNLLTVTKQKPQNDYEVQAITASTITSRAFLLAVNNAYQAYMNKMTPVDAHTGATSKAPHE